MITATEHNLPFSELSPEQFEQLCLALLEAEGHTGVRHWGAAGNEGGCDLVSTGGDRRRWVTQAKRTQGFGPAAALGELRKVLDAPPAPPPEVYLLAATWSVERGVHRVRPRLAGLRRRGDPLAVEEGGGVGTVGWTRLRLAQGDRDAARRHLERGRELVTATGYGRREREVAYLAKRLGADERRG